MLDIEKLEKEIKEDKQSQFDRDGYLITFKGIKKQFISILEKRKEIAYQKAYDFYMNSPKALLELASAEEDKNNSELRRKKVEADAIKLGKRLKRKQSPQLHCVVRTF